MTVPALLPSAAAPALRPIWQSRFSASCVESLIEYSGSTPHVECASTQ